MQIIIFLSITCIWKKKLLCKNLTIMVKQVQSNLHYGAILFSSWPSFTTVCTHNSYILKVDFLKLCMVAYYHMRISDCYTMLSRPFLKQLLSFLTFHQNMMFDWCLTPTLAVFQLYHRVGVGDKCVSFKNNLLFHSVSVT